MKRYNLLVFFKIGLFLLVSASIGKSYSKSFEGSFASKYKRFEKYEPFESDVQRHFHDVVWRGDRVHQQIVVWSDKKRKKLSHTISDLVSGEYRIDASAIQLRFVRYAKGDPEARDCENGYPDRKWPPAIKNAVLIADVLSEEPFEQITAKDSLKYWLTIDVPVDTKPGMYTGEVTISAAGETLFFDVSLNVVDQVLPAPKDWQFHLDLWQFPMSVLNRYNEDKINPKFHIEPWSEKHLQMLEPTYRLLANAGQKTITTYIKEGAANAPSMVKWYLEKDGKTWRYDFSIFDRYVEALMSWGIDEQISAFSPVGWNKSVIPFTYEKNGRQLEIDAPIGSEHYNSLWNDFLTAFKAHLEKKGWFDKTVLYFDEVPEKEMEDVIGLIKYNSQEWGMGIAYSHTTKAEVLAEFADLSGIFKVASEIPHEAWQIKTFYTSCTQTIPNNYLTPQNNSAELTWMAWHAMRENFKGYLRWAFDHWILPDPYDLRDNAFTAGDNSFVYRTSNNFPMEVASSIRFEMLREGIQDFEKVRLLREQLNVCDNKKALDDLSNTINLFDAQSGEQGKSEDYVVKAQQLIKKISISPCSTAN